MNDNLLINKSIKNKKSLISKFRAPPYSLEAEQSILGGLMLDNDKWDIVSELLVVDDFFSSAHRVIFTTMQYLFDNGNPIDLITLSESLEQNGNIDNVGGFAYLAELSKNVPSSANISTYASIVRERSIVRNIISVANKIVDAGYFLNGKKSEDLIDFAESSIMNISRERLNKSFGPKRIEHILDITISNIERLFKTPNGDITGINTGYIDINKKTAGLQPSDLIIVAARPSMGKTTLAMNICENVSMIYDKPILIFSLEMSSEQIMIRMLSSLSRVDQSKIRAGKLSDEDWLRISSTVKVLLDRKNIYIDDSSSLTPIEMSSRARRVYRENNGLSLIMIDYLQLMRVPYISDNRNVEIGEISRSLKSLAKELKVPIMALSQLNRSLEQRVDKRPVNSDLRESGSIEQDADLIMFIYRDELYNEHSDLKGVAEIIIGKQRNGPIGTVRLIFNGNWSRFDNYTSFNYENN
ncbi:replicative DNA helicase [Candidatus Purcelliella pentastirinorum]|uniref:Replicative DNA helicase n=1 Tax=Candidatus Purcelliella pentastirinorum TaxID=472834 RepID=A0AAX3N765_9ENTR|nr:replicative DNA helicase [Candidatus Purcelliella pentastirinorum]WDI78377.1 replicative DNA helicase [Candidatus Purcelliella pentastirinorum]WDR80596.1 replicative DNA helicase [Candidatus Purcelliella pentastirinorum]